MGEKEIASLFGGICIGLCIGGFILYNITSLSNPDIIKFKVAELQRVQEIVCNIEFKKARK